MSDVWTVRRMRRQRVDSIKRWLGGNLILTLHETGLVVACRDVP